MNESACTGGRVWMTVHVQGEESGCFINTKIHVLIVKNMYVE